jgi:hypothetical protein
VAPFQKGYNSFQPYFTPENSWNKQPCYGGFGGRAIAPSIVNSQSEAVSASNYAEAVANAMSQAFGGPAYAGEWRARFSWMLKRCCLRENCCVLVPSADS